jgi:beta-alanine degradation protein BauB
MSRDPAVTNPDYYKVVFENERASARVPRQAGRQDNPARASRQRHVRVEHLRRRLYSANGDTRDVELEAGTTGWLPAQQHAGHTPKEIARRLTSAWIRRRIG